MGHYERTARFELQKTNRKRKKNAIGFYNDSFGEKNVSNESEFYDN